MALSEMGNLAAIAAVAVTAIAEGAPIYLGAVLAAQSLPAILLGRWIPKVISGWGVAMWRELLLIQAAVFVLLATFSTNLTLIVLGIAVVGVVEAFLVPFSRAVLGDLSRPAGAAVLARWWGVAKSFAGAVGFVLAGTLIQESSVSWVFALNALTFIVMACAAVVVPATAVGRAGAEPGSAAAKTPSLFEGFGQLASPRVFSRVGLAALGSVLLATSLESVSGPFVVGGYSGYTPVHLALTVAAWPVMATVSSLLMPEKWGARRESLCAGACLIGLGLIWISVADSWSYGIVGFALAGSGNGLVNIALSAAIWADVPTAMQRATWSAFNFMLASMLIIGFSVGSAVGPGVAPQVVFVGGAIAFAVNAAYVASRANGRRRLALDQG